MKKIITLFLLVDCLAVSAQLFELDPGTDHYAVLEMEITSEVITDIYNLTPDSMTMEWRRFENTCPAELWHMEMCDNINCYDYMPTTGIMAPVASGQAGKVRLIVNAQNISGSGMVHYWVYPLGLMDDHVDFYFYLSTIDVSVNNLAVSHVQLYPNPANGQLYVSADWMGQCRILSPLGSEVKTGNKNSVSEIIDISGLAGGVYFLQIGNHQPFKFTIN